jgi:hypothetical protein
MKNAKIIGVNTVMIIKLHACDYRFNFMHCTKPLLFPKYWNVFSIKGILMNSL